MLHTLADPSFGPNLERAGRYLALNLAQRVGTYKWGQTTATYNLVSRKLQPCPDCKAAGLLS